MESNPSEPLGFYVTLGAEPLKADLVDDEGNPVTRVYPIGGQYSRINFTNWHHSTDPQVTGIMLYQSEPVETSIDGREPDTAYWEVEQAVPVPADSHGGMSVHPLACLSRMRNRLVPSR